MPKETIKCDIVIQAGHQNTPDGKTGGSGPLGDEIDWTPIVADTAVEILKKAGVNVVKEDASIKGSCRYYHCQLAVFLHFDDPDCGESGPSVGYPDDDLNRQAAQEWKELYSRYWPFPDTWKPDNYTSDEACYYGYARTWTTDAEFLIEFGDLGSRRQAEWMKPRLEWMGRLLAFYLSRRSGLGSVRDPGPYGEHEARAPVGHPAPKEKERVRPLRALLSRVPSAGGAQPEELTGSNGWQVTGYFTASEDMYQGPRKVVNVAGVGAVDFPADFLHHVMVEGWGETRFGWFLGWDNGWVKNSKGALNACGELLKKGSLAVDFNLIPRGTKVRIPTLPAPWNEQEFIADDTGGAIQGMHVDVYCGAGPDAQNETYRITEDNMRLCQA